MIREKEIADPNSCLNKAVPGEPVFVLRANDGVASGIVRTWAERYVASKGGLRQMTDVQIEKYFEALKLADAMDTWAAQRGAG